MTDLIKKVQTLVGVVSDGVIGSKTLAAIAEALDIKPSSYKKTTIKNIQVAIGVTKDGIIGKNTLNALIATLSSMQIKKKEVKPEIKKYIEKPINFTKINYKAEPVTQKKLRSGSSIFGKAGCESELVSVKVPSNYPLYYGNTRVKSIRIHKLVADRLEAALNDIINHYGDDIEIVAPAICKYDGSYNFRNSRNSSSQSVHSWGLALDFDAENNTMKMSAPKARLSQDIYKPFFDIMEYHGFLSLGRRGDYDWMHVQATLW
jgi:hypothetical protein